METIKKLIVVGAGGHAAVILNLIRDINKNNYEWDLVGCLDDCAQECLGNPVIGKIEDMSKYRHDHYFVFAIGNNSFRAKLAETYQNYCYATLIHPTAIVATEVSIGAGTVVLPQVVVHPRTQIGDHVIINTGAIVEHDNIIADYVHLSPRATLCGSVVIGKQTHVGAGSTVIQGIRVVEKCVIGAGATLISDCRESGTYIGVPAQKKR